MLLNYKKKLIYFFYGIIVYVKQLIHKSFFEGGGSASKVASWSSKNTQDLFSRYQDYWTDGWGEIGDFVEKSKSFLNWFQESMISGGKFFDLNHSFLKNNLKIIQDLGNFIIKEWWFNNKKFKTPGDEFVLKIITILYPGMIFQEQSNSCAIISTRFIGQNQLKVEVEHDPMDCYTSEDGIHSDRYHG